MIFFETHRTHSFIKKKHIKNYVSYVSICFKKKSSYVYKKEKLCATMWLCVYKKEKLCITM